jgi:hypothetical protein
MVWFFLFLFLVVCFLCVFCKKKKKLSYNYNAGACVAHKPGEEERPTHLTFLEAFPETVATMKAFILHAKENVPDLRSVLDEVPLSVSKTGLAHGLEKCSVPLSYWTDFLQERATQRKETIRQEKKKAQERFLHEKEKESAAQRAAPRQKTSADLMQEEYDSMIDRRGGTSLVTAVQASMLWESAKLKVNEAGMRGASRRTRQQRSFGVFVSH